VSGRRGRALNGQQRGGSVSTISHDVYSTGTHFPGLRTRKKTFAKLLSFWNFQNWNRRNTLYRNVLKMRGVHLNNASSFRMRTVIWFGMLIYLISMHIWAGGSLLHITERERERDPLFAAALSLTCRQESEREGGGRAKGKEHPVQD